MIWYTWRQSRLALLCFFVVSLGIALALIIIGLRMYQDVHILQNPLCQQGDACIKTSNDFFRKQSIFHNISIGLLALPALMGIFIGVPLVAGEYEQRTYQFIWTQSVTRRRWLTIQLAILFGAVIALTAILSLLVNWGVSTAFARTDAFSPGSSFTPGFSERFSPWGFDLSGMVPVAYATFALTLGLASGALLRRTLPAIAVTLVVYLGVRLPLALFARPYYLPPLSRTFDIRAGLPFPSDSITGPFAWILGDGVQHNGHLYPNGFEIPSYCASDAGSDIVNPDALNQCLHDHGWSLYILYQPYSRFWPFQGIETAIFLALTIGLVVATFALVLRRPH